MAYLIRVGICLHQGCEVRSVLHHIFKKEWSLCGPVHKKC